MNDENKDMSFENNENPENDSAVESASEVSASEESAPITEEPTISKAGARGIGKTLAKILIAVLSFLVVLSLVATASYAAVSNYVLFPDFDDALANSLENKLDFGTEFDFAALENAGKIELEMYPSKEEAKESDVDKVIASISYNGLKEASMKLTIGDEIANAYINESSVAANIERFNDGKSYGISLEDIVDRLEGSFLDPDEESDYVQLTDAQFDELEDMLETLIEMKENEKEYQKDLAVLLDVIEDAFNNSTLSEHEVSYGGIKIFGEERSARCKRYDFDLDDIEDFVDCLADEFSEPSARLEKAVENLFDNDSSPFASIAEGYDCDDIVDKLDELADSIKDIAEDVDFTVILAYSSNAFTAIQVKAQIKDTMDIIATIDFGESPKKDKGIIVNVDVTDVANNNGKMNVRLATELEEGDSKSEARMILSVDLPENKNEIVLSAEFDRAKEKAVFSANTKTTIKEGGEELTTEAGEEELFKFTFKMLDTKSKFSLTVDELISGGEKAEDIDGEIILSFYKKPDRTRAPKFTDLVDMKVRDFDRLVDDLLDYLEDLGEDYEAIFDIDISGVIPDIEIPGMHLQPDYEDEDDVIGGGNNDDVIGGGNNDEYIGGIVDGDYFYSDPDGLYNENYRFSGDRYYYNAYDVENDEYLVQESGTYRMIGENVIVFSPDGAGEFGEYEVYVSIYPDRLVMFDMQYKKVS